MEKIRNFRDLKVGDPCYRVVYSTDPGKYTIYKIFVEKIDTLADSKHSTITFRYKDYRLVCPDVALNSSSHWCQSGKLHNMYFLSSEETLAFVGETFKNI